ncbi:pathogenesis-related protein 2-like [Prosopis cineraria]|uniref:pathogenesis-related protein 2-like n=1 Tax=Prosopis cineraria TaxID=364024 RepID=UPI00240EC07D|nr:pathogenesis-related protein 2-like [Prosopis cineraria]
MGVFTYETETVSVVPPAKLYNTFVKQFDTIFPKANPSVKSVQVIEGTGGPGSIKKITSVGQGGNAIDVLHKVDEIDEANLRYNYSVVGGNKFPESLEKVCFETKVVGGCDGGSIVNFVIKYHTKGNSPPAEDLVKRGKMRGEQLFKVVADYIVASPDFNITSC